MFSQYKQTLKNLKAMNKSGDYSEQNLNEQLIYLPVHIQACIQEYMGIKFEEKNKNQHNQWYWNVMKVLKEMKEKDWIWGLEELKCLLKNDMMEEQKHILLYNLAIVYLALRAYKQCISTANDIKDVSIDHLLNLEWKAYVQSGISMKSLINREQNPERKFYLQKLYQKVSVYRGIHQICDSLQEFKKKNNNKQVPLFQYYNIALIVKNKYHEQNLAKKMLQQVISKIKDPQHKLHVYCKINISSIYQQGQLYHEAIVVLKQILSEVPSLNQRQTKQIKQRIDTLEKMENLTIAISRPLPLTKENIKELKWINKQNAELIRKEHELNSLLGIQIRHPKFKKTENIQNLQISERTFQNKMSEISCDNRHHTNVTSERKSQTTKKSHLFIKKKHKTRQFFVQQQSQKRLNKTVKVKNKKLKVSQSNISQIPKIKISLQPTQKSINSLVQERKHDNKLQISELDQATNQLTSSLRTMKTMLSKRIFNQQQQISSKKVIFDLEEEIQKFDYVISPPKTSQKTSKKTSISSSEKRLLEEEDYENLIEKYERKVRDEKNQKLIAQYNYKLGQLYELINDRTLAIKMYQMSLEQGHFLSYLKLGIMMHNEGNLFAAINFYEKYLDELKISDLEAEMKLIHCYSKIPQFYSKAIERLKQIQSNNTYYASAITMLIGIYAKQKNFDKGIELCQKYTEKDSSDYRIFHIMGLLHKQNHSTKKAYESFINALNLNPLSTESIIEICDFIEVSEDMQEELLSLLRKSLFQQQKNTELLLIIKHVIEGKPVNRTLCNRKIKFAELIEIGNLFMEEGLVLEAEYVYKWASNITMNLVVTEKLGDVAFAKGQYPKAEELYLKSLKKSFSLETYFKIGIIKMKKGLYQEAITIFKYCLEHDKDELASYITLIGHCEYELQNYDGAKECFLQSYQTNKSIEINKQMLNRCEEQLELRKSRN